MKKKIILALCLMLTVGCLTGCGKKDGNKNNNGSLNGSKDGYKVEDKTEVFQPLDEKLLNDALWNEATFFYLVDDGTDESILLKDEVEKLARENKWTVYYVNFKEEYEKSLKEHKEELEAEEQNYIDTYCKMAILTPEEVEMYEGQKLEQDENGNYIHLKCSYEIAKEKNEDFSFDESEELGFISSLKEKLKDELLEKYKTEYSKNLILVHKGTIAGDLEGYLPEDFAFLSKDEKAAMLTESNKNLSEWFNSIVRDINNLNE